MNMNYSDLSVRDLRKALSEQVKNSAILVPDSALEALNSAGYTVYTWANKANKDELIQALKHKLVDVKLVSRIVSGESESPKAKNDSGGKAASVEQGLGLIVSGIMDTVTKDVKDKVQELSGEVEKLRSAMKTAVPMSIKVSDLPPVKIEKQHEAFEDILLLLANGQNVWLVGPAGSGKTTLGESAAKALGLKFYPRSCGRMMVESQLLGYMAGHGYVPGIVREPFEHGGVLLLDEIDNSSVALTVLNSAVENGYCSFPDKVVKQHKDFKVIASSNTWGLGATAEYMGRVPVDAATRDRFAFVEIGYDFELEKLMANGNKKWFCRVASLRMAADDLGIKLLISPRATRSGAIMLSAGMPQDKVEKAFIWKSSDNSIKSKIEIKAKDFLPVASEVWGS